MHLFNQFQKSPSICKVRNMYVCCLPQKISLVQCCVVNFAISLVMYQCVQVFVPLYGVFIIDNVDCNAFNNNKVNFLPLILFMFTEFFLVHVYLVNRQQLWQWWNFMTHSDSKYNHVVDRMNYSCWSVLLLLSRI